MEKLVKHWQILSDFFFTPLFLLVPVALTNTNTLSACHFDFHVGRLNPGTFGAALTSRCSGHSESLIPSSCSVSDQTSAAQSSSVSFGLSKSPFQSSQSMVSEMIWGVLSSSPSTGWWLILQIRRKFNNWVRPPRRSFADKTGGKVDLSDSLNAATPSYWKTDQDAVRISSMSEIHSTAIICIFWVRDSFCVAHRFWLPCHISQMAWTLAILCNVLSESFPVFVVSNAGSSPTKMRVLARPNCLTMTFLRRVSPVGVDCLQPITSRPREKLDSTLPPCGMIENVLHATLERSAYFECIPSCWRHQSVMSGNQNLLLISIGSEWSSLRFGLICPQVFGASCGEFWESLVAVIERVARSLRRGVVSATLYGVQYSSSLLDKSYESKDDWPDPESNVEGMRLLLSTLSASSTGTHRSLAQYWFSTYFGNASFYQVVENGSSSGLMSIPLSHFRNDRNFQTGSRICAEIRFIPVVGVTSA